MASASYKLIVLGDAGVGKTSIINRKTYNTFDTTMPMTVGVSNCSIFEKVKGKKVELKVWDTAGQEQYSSLIPMFSRNSDVCILVCDINQPDSFTHLDVWTKRLKDSGCDPPIILAVNKIDINPKYYEEMSQKSSVFEKYDHFTFVSAKTGYGISDLFNIAADLAVKYDESVKASDSSKMSRNSQDISSGKEKSDCC